MSSGGGGTQTTVQQNGPPPDVLANYKDITAQARNVAQQPFPTYNGQLIAGFNPEQQAAFQNIDTAATAGSPFINAASGAATNAINLLSPQNFGNTIGAYQNPYTKQVVDATQAEQANQNAIQQQQVKGNAISSGAWGGDRSAVAQGITAGQQALAEAPVIAGLNSQGFNTALNAAQGNAWLNSQGAFSLGQLGQEAQQQGLAGANAQLQAGTLQQQMAQQQLNVPYQQFLAAQGYPYQVTNWLSGIETGLGGASGGTSSTTSPGPSPVSQIGGLGLAGAGILGASGAFGSNGWLTGGGGGGGGGGFVDSGSFAVRRGGRIERAIGGPVASDIPGMPDVNIDVVPPVSPGSGAGMGGLGIFGNTGSTSTGSGGGPSDMQQAQSAIGTIASIAALVALLNRGGRVHRADGGDVAGFGGVDIPLPHIPHGKGPPRAPAPSAPSDILASLGGLGSVASMANMIRHTDAQGGRVSGLDPFEGFDDGGMVPPASQAMFSGNPIMAQNFSQYAGLPTEKLHELAARLPPTTPQGAMVARALKQRQMTPQSDPAQQPSSAGLGAAPGTAATGLGVMPSQGFADGGAPVMDLSSAYDDVPQLGGGDAPAFDDYVPPPRDVVLPPPVAAPQDTGEPVDGQGTFGGAPVPHKFPWESLVAAGLGIAGGRSPFPGVNIGQGGLEGLKLAEQQRLRETQQEDNRLYRMGALGVRNRGVDVQQQRADTGQQRANTADRSVDVRADLGSQSLALRQQIADRAAEFKARGYNDAQANALARLDVARGNLQLKQTAVGNTAAYRDQRLKQIDQAAEQRAQTIAQSKEAQTARLQLQREGRDAAGVNADIGAASRMVASGAVKDFDTALKQVRAGRGATPVAPAASARTQSPTDLPDGTIVNQGGARYRKQGDQWLPVQ